MGLFNTNIKDVYPDFWERYQADIKKHNDLKRSFDELKQSYDTLQKDFEEVKVLMIEELKERLWYVYTNYQRYKKEYFIKRDFFSEQGGVLYYFQQIFGYYRYQIADDDLTEDQIDYFIKKYLIPLENAMTIAKSNLVKKENISEFIEDRNAFMFNEGITESDMSIKHVREVLSKYEHETMELLKDSNYILYHTLWEHSFKSIDFWGNEFAKHLKTEETTDKLKELIKQQILEVEDLFKSSGIGICYREDDCLRQEDREELFMLSRNKERYPAIYRKSDKYIYHKGRELNQEEL